METTDNKGNAFLFIAVIGMFTFYLFGAKAFIIGCVIMMILILVDYLISRKRKQ